jgi:hypothetical protein
MHRRKQDNLLQIYKALKVMFTLSKISQQIQKLLVEMDYTAAIQLLLQHQHTAQTYKQFKCVSDISLRLQDTLDMAEEQLDVGLEKCCTHFDAVLYSKLYHATLLLGKQDVIDQLNLHMTSSLHHSSLILIKDYVECSDTDKIVIHYNKLQFQDLCKHVSLVKISNYHIFYISHTQIF